MISKAFRLSRVEAESLKNGKSVFTTLISLRTLPAPHLKLSVSVPKKIAKQAVDRNFIRRRCYRAIEESIPLIKKPSRVMVFPKKEAKKAPYQLLVTDIREAFIKAGIISK
jgi:ribonuclease P protein component